METPEFDYNLTPISPVGDPEKTYKYLKDMYYEGITLASDWCECGHHRNSHDGHTHIVGTPAPVYCACCDCKEFKTKEL
jgi:hypothetical protein